MHGLPGNLPFLMCQAVTLCVSVMVVDLLVVLCLVCGVCSGVLAVVGSGLVVCLARGACVGFSDVGLSG